MSKSVILAGALGALAGLSPASAQHWSVGVGVGFGAPGYYAAPPPAYLYEQPPVIYEQPPAVYVPAPPVASAVPPDVVFDMLEQAGYREFSPMAFRDGVYKLKAVNPRGDLVALEVSALTGAVEVEYLIAARQTAVPVPAVPPPPARVPQTESGPSEDPLVVY